MELSHEPPIKFFPFHLIYRQCFDYQKSFEIHVNQSNLLQMKICHGNVETGNNRVLMTPYV